MFYKTIGFVSFLIICGIKAVNSLGIPSCTSYENIFNNECQEGNPIYYCINNSKNGDNKIYGVNGEKSACTSPIEKGTYAFYVDDNYDATLVTETTEILKDYSLVLYQCSTTKKIISCKKTAGYIKMSNKNEINYYSISVDSSSSKVNDRNLSSSNYGQLFRKDEDNEAYLLIDDNISIHFPYEEIDKRNYLIRNNISSGPFRGLIQNNNEVYGAGASIVISSLPSYNNNPSMITFNAFYSKTNYCYDNVDGELLNRKKNLCKSRSDCEYYYCNNGICKPSSNSCQNYEDNSCDPTNYETRKNCEDGYYIYNESERKLVTDTEQIGTLYYCSKKYCNKIRKLGYYINNAENQNSLFKYIKCTKQYYALTYEKNYNKRENMNERQKYRDHFKRNISNRYSEKDEEFNNNKDNTNSYQLVELSSIVCQGFYKENLETTCNEKGQLIMNNNKVQICLSNNDENVLSFAENGASPDYELIDGNILTINVNSTKTITVPDAVVEIRNNSIEMAVGSFLMNNKKITAEADVIGSFNRCYGYWCEDTNIDNVGYFTNKLYNPKDETSSPYIQCSKGENGHTCKNIKVTKTKCGTGENDAKEGELFITSKTEGDENENLYFDGNSYNICLDTTTTNPISLNLNYDITSTTYYMIGNSENNIFSTEKDGYNVINVLQYDIESEYSNNLFRYSDNNYKIVSRENAFDENSICYVTGQLIEFEGNCEVTDYFIENCTSYRKTQNIIEITDDTKLIYKDKELDDDMDEESDTKTK